MTALTDFFCDYCNAGAEMDDALEGYARELAPNTPLGWWEVPGKGPGDTTGHACPHCVLNSPDVRHDIARRRGAETDRLIGRLGTHLEDLHDDEVMSERKSEDEPTWPSRTSPFDGEAG